MALTNASFKIILFLMFMTINFAFKYFMDIFGILFPLKPCYKYAYDIAVK